MRIIQTYKKTQKDNLDLGVIEAAGSSTVTQTKETVGRMGVISESAVLFFAKILEKYGKAKSINENMIPNKDEQ